MDEQELAKRVAAFFDDEIEELGQKLIQAQKQELPSGQLMSPDERRYERDLMDRASRYALTLVSDLEGDEKEAAYQKSVKPILDRIVKTYVLSGR